MLEEPELSHDQLIARVQAFYSHLRKQYEDLKLAKCCPCGDDGIKKIIQAQYDDASELLELYSHTFEKVLYTWMD